MDAYLDESRTAELFSDPALKALVAERNARNPRRIKRFINAFILEWGLDHAWAEEGFNPAVVVRVVILYLYFPDFAALLEAPTDEDPVENFGRYLEVRRTLRQQPASADAQAWKIVHNFSARYPDLPRIPEDQTNDPLGALRVLEEELPSCFAQLARQEGFVRLIEGLGGPEDRDRLRMKLQRRRPIVEIDPAAADHTVGPVNYRFDVTTMTDPAASRVNLDPRPATIAELTALPALAKGSERGDAEFNAYQVSGTITFAKRQVSDDITMVLADDAGGTLILRSVSPRWADESVVGDQIYAVRQAVETQFPTAAAGGSERPSVPATVSGVGFFDQLHGQTGIAPNGFGLRPLLSFQAH
jgi:hypothetical protein